MLACAPFASMKPKESVSPLASVPVALPDMEDALVEFIAAGEHANSMTERALTLRVAARSWGTRRPPHGSRLGEEGAVAAQVEPVKAVYR